MPTPNPTPSLPPGNMASDPDGLTGLLVREQIDEILADLRREMIESVDRRTLGRRRSWFADYVADHLGNFAIAVVTLVVGLSAMVLAGPIVANHFAEARVERIEHAIVDRLEQSVQNVWTVEGGKIFNDVIQGLTKTSAEIGDLRVTYDRQIAQVEEHFRLAKLEQDLALEKLSALEQQFQTLKRGHEDLTSTANLPGKESGVSENPAKSTFSKVLPKSEILAVEKIQRLDGTWFFGPQVHMIDLSHTRADDQVVKTIVDDLPNVRWLSLANCPAISDAAVANLGRLKYLRVLILRDNPGITSTSFLRGLTSVAHLDISGTGVIDTALEDIAQMNLRTLDLSNTRITEDALRHIPTQTNMEILRLTGTKLSIVGIKKLQREIPKCSVEHELLRAPSTVVTRGVR